MRPFRWLFTCLVGWRERRERGDALSDAERDRNEDIADGFWNRYSDPETVRQIEESKATRRAARTSPAR